LALRTRKAYKVSDANQLDSPQPKTMMDEVLPNTSGKRVAFSAIERCQHILHHVGV
jgi:hypothetical protein